MPANTLQSSERLRRQPVCLVHQAHPTPTTWAPRPVGHARQATTLQVLETLIALPVNQEQYQQLLGLLLRLPALLAHQEHPTTTTWAERHVGLVAQVFMHKTLATRIALPVNQAQYPLLLGLPLHLPALLAQRERRMETLLAEVPAGLVDLATMPKAVVMATARVVL